MRLQPWPAAAVLSGLLLLGACESGTESGDGSSTTEAGAEVDTTAETDEVEQLITASQRQETPDLEVKEAICPDDLDVATEKSFECTVTIAGVEAAYTVEASGLTGEGDDSGNIKFAPTRPILSRAAIVQLIRDNIEVGAAKVSIDCGPDAVRVEEVGAVFDCTISDGPQVQVVKVTVADKSGQVSVAPA